MIVFHRLVIGLIAFSCSDVFAQDASVEELVGRLNGTKTVDVRKSDIPVEHYSAVIELLRLHSERKQGKATRLLLRLGDEVTIRKEVQHFIETNGTDWMRMQALRGTPSVELIAALAPLTARDDSFEYHASPNPEFPGSFGVPFESAMMIRDKLIRTPEIPAAVSAWARTLPVAVFDESPVTPNGVERMYTSLRDTMRRWWFENRERFEKGEIEQLQPLGDAATPR